MYKDSLSPVVHFSSVRPALTLAVSYNDVDHYIGDSSAVPCGHLPKPLSIPGTTSLQHDYFFRDSLFLSINEHYLWSTHFEISE
jgi:hypothetical protein